MSHDSCCRLANKPGAVDLHPCPECSAESDSQERVGVVSLTAGVSQPEKHDPFCRYRHDDRLARHDCDLCDLIARVRAERGES